MVFYKKPKKMLIELKKSIQKVISSRFARHSNLCYYLFNTQKSGEFSNIITCWIWQGVEESSYSLMIQSKHFGARSGFSLSG